MSYTFDSSVMSAAKTGTPPQTGSHITLSAYGVNTISLASDVVGLSFNKNATLTGGTLSGFTVGGSVFKIDPSYNGMQMALIKTPVNNKVNYSVFTFTANLTGTSTLTTSDQVSTTESRRKHLLGW